MTLLILFKALAIALFGLVFTLSSVVLATVTVNHRSLVNSHTGLTRVIAKRTQCTDQYHIVTISGPVVTWGWGPFPGEGAIKGSICSGASGTAPGSSKVSGDFTATFKILCRNNTGSGTIDFVFVSSGASSALPHGTNGGFGGSNPSGNVPYNVRCG
ncbi:hypothetical protein BDZ90DRAFT_2580 [Jaminaea rosea]|uniref:Uncharacterized protein n=1 Tax=Jaminaea rosea TaxID=1569628 RepID=A0A316UXG2_9BASI|nr:hypothetical protein BDZ90DRAFT_2580 [Jaminaea rosea]PWN29999.1 hypothetical protein BDZ90DRAFT_2580 [Jaminaea rosea]